MIRLCRGRPSEAARRNLGQRRYGLGVCGSLVSAARGSEWRCDGQYGNFSGAEAARTFVWVMWLGVALTMPLGTTLAVLRADQQVDKAAAVTALGSLVRLLLLALVVQMDGGFTWLVVAGAFGPLLPMAIASVRVMGRYVSWPNPRRFARGLVLGIVTTGVGFMGVTVARLAATSVDILIVAALFGPADVTTYSVPFALLLLYSGVATAVLEGLWPAYAQAASVGDLRWVQRANRSVTFGLLAAGVVFAVGLTAVGGTFIRLWAGPEAAPPASLLAVFGVVAIVQAIEIPHNRVLMATGHVRRSTTYGLIAAAVNVPLSVFLGSLLGLTGVAAGTLVAYLLVLGFIVRDARRAMTPSTGSFDTTEPAQSEDDVDNGD